MKSNKKTDVRGWDTELVLQRLCEAFEKANNEGRTYVTVNDFYSSFHGLDFDAVLDILNEYGVYKGIIKIKDNTTITQTPLGIEKCKEIQKRLGGEEKPV